MSALNLQPVALLTGLLIVGSSCGGEAPPAEATDPVPQGLVRLSEAQMRVAAIEASPIDVAAVSQPIAVPGTVQPPDTAQAIVGSIVDGRVMSVHVLPGDRVRRGATLVEIHSEELSTAQRDLSAAEADLSFHERSLQRSEALLEAGAVSLEEVERRQADFQAATAELQRAQEIVDHLYPTRRGNTSAVAPRAGTVFKVLARPGQAVLKGAPLVEMGSTDVLWVTAFVPEHTASTLSVGDRVQVRFGSPPDAVASAHLVRSGDYVDPANRSVEMRFALDSIPPGVRAGSFAVVDVEQADVIEGVRVPQDVAVRMDGQDVVFLVEEPGLFRPWPVSVTPVREGWIAVQGIPQGAAVVTQGAYFLKSAMEVGQDEPGQDR
ncbi:MAG: efflux RND transporter periplasmic adaptor subunit [Gemmatimonadetes bacterium]|nr:efflux RND transporter periplasmic adaptor subunit [Gemmatimonadota bacterium]